MMEVEGEALTCEGNGEGRRECISVSEGRLSEKATYCLTQIIWDSGNCKLHRM
jgi:hypothetical protein